MKDLPVPTPQSGKEEWQSAYNAWFDHYRGMGGEASAADDYRARDARTRWVRSMVCASLGTVWEQCYPHLGKAKRDQLWSALERDYSPTETAFAGTEESMQPAHPAAQEEFCLS